MVGIGVIMILVGIWGLVQRIRGKLSHPGLMHHILLWLIPTPFIAVIAGWFTTEVGRSPWLVYGIIDHAQGVTPSLSTGMALTSLIGFLMVYAVVYSAGLTYLIKTVKNNVREK